MAKRTKTLSDRSAYIELIKKMNTKDTFDLFEEDISSTEFGDTSKYYDIHDERPRSFCEKIKDFGNEKKSEIIFGLIGFVVVAFMGWVGYLAIDLRIKTSEFDIMLDMQKEKIEELNSLLSDEAESIYTEIDEINNLIDDIENINNEQNLLLNELKIKFDFLNPK